MPIATLTEEAMERTFRFPLEWTKQCQILEVHDLSARLGL